MIGIIFTSEMLKSCCYLVKTRCLLLLKMKNSLSWGDEQRNIEKTRFVVFIMKDYSQSIFKYSCLLRSLSLSISQFHLPNRFFYFRDGILDITSMSRIRASISSFSGKISLWIMMIFNFQRMSFNFHLSFLIFKNRSCLHWFAV